MQAPRVIKHHGRPMEAVDLSGQRIERKDLLFVRSHRAWYPVLPYDNHFVYMSNRVGSTMMCTCGSAAAVLEYPYYRQYESTNRGPTVCCLAQIEYGRHADGSS